VRVTEQLVRHGVDAFVFVGLYHDPSLFTLLEGDAKPYVLTWDEQERFLSAIGKRWLRDAVILGVNCGAREGELCALRWDWAVERGDRMLFVLPGSLCKNGQERVLVPNRAAQSVLCERRLLGTPTVLAYANGKPIMRINGDTWGEAWKPQDCLQGVSTGAALTISGTRTAIVSRTKAPYHLRKSLIRLDPACLMHDGRARPPRAGGPFVRRHNMLAATIGAVPGRVEP